METESNHFNPWSVLAVGKAPEKSRDLLIEKLKEEGEKRYRGFARLSVSNVFSSRPCCHSNFFEDKESFPPTKTDDNSESQQHCWNVMEELDWERVYEKHS